MLNVKSVDEVFNIIDEVFAKYILDSEDINIKKALNRIVVNDIFSSEHVPGFNRSSVDGYAVISADTFGASDTMPAQLFLAGEVQMGDVYASGLLPGQTVYVPTGGELPVNADGVIMMEYSEDYGDGYIYLGKSCAPGNNVVFKGDDVKPGDIVIKAGTILRPQEIGVLAALGIETVKVKRRLKVGIISTGDEIVDIQEKAEGAKVRDINSYVLYAALVDYGCEPHIYGIVKDQYNEIRNMVIKAINECDVVLISGGSSVGTKDETYNIINSLGEPGVVVHGIAVKPGKPTIIGDINGKAVIGLPGHPASAYMIFRVFVVHLLDRMSGVKKRYLPDVSAKMACNYPSNNGREEYLTVRLDNYEGEIAASPVFGKSGLITLLTQADGYVHIDRSKEGLAKGEIVEVILL